MFVIALATGALVLANVIGWRLQRLAAVALALAALLLCLWLFSLSSEGFMDCWPTCTGRQDASRGIFFSAPLLMIGELVVAFLSYGKKRTT